MTGFGNCIMSHARSLDKGLASMTGAESLENAGIEVGEEDGEVVSSMRGCGPSSRGDQGVMIGSTQRHYLRVD